MRKFSGFYALAAVVVVVSILLTACGENVPAIEINNDGFWVINGENTGISAKGEDGKDGINGVNGTNGINGINGINGVDGIDGKDGIDGQGNGAFIHISFDDVSTCLAGLASGKYSSLFDEPFFAWLSQLHYAYGAKFSLYCYTSSLSAVPSNYADEFFEAREWLKLGLHADNSSSTFKNYTYEQGKTSWNAFVECLCGTGGEGNRLLSKRG